MKLFVASLGALKRLSFLDLKSIASMSSYPTVTYVTCPNIEVARCISEGLVKNKLAACVNIVKGVESVYEWKGKIEHDDEHLLIVKSLSSKVLEFERYILSQHPYDCPEIVTLKVDSGSQEYFKWIEKALER